MSNEIGRDLDPLVIRTDNNGTSTLTLNRPKSYNALSQSLMLELQTHLDNLRIDRSIMVVVIREPGQVFLQGMISKKCRMIKTKFFFETFLSNAPPLCKVL